MADQIPHPTLHGDREPGPAREMALTIAGNVRRFRTARGMSLAELARHSQVAKATLSQIELAKGNPTIETLHSVSRSLGVQLGDLLLEHEQPALRVVRADSGSMVRGMKVDLRFIHRTVTDELMYEIFEMGIRPGRQLSHPHPSGVIEHILVTRGRLIVGPEDQLVELGEGDFVAFAADCRHSYEALGDPVTTTMMMTYPRVNGPAWGFGGPAHGVLPDTGGPTAGLLPPPG